MDRTPRDEATQPNTVMPFAPDTLVVHVVDALRRAGITKVFGVSGGNVCTFFTAAEAAGFTIVGDKHECSAAFAAASYAVATQRPAIVAATSGPGVLNMLNGVRMAQASGAPVLVICGASVSGRNGFGTIQEYAGGETVQHDVVRPLVKFSSVVTQPEQLLPVLAHAYAEMMSGRRGPVAVHVPHDFWTRTVVPDRVCELGRGLVCTVGGGISGDVDAAAALICKARRPVLIVGSGVRASGAEHVVAALAERVACAVVTTAFAKNVFPEDHRLSAGMLLFGGTKNAAAVVRDADVIVVVGSSLTESTLPMKRDLGADHAVVRIDVDVNSATRCVPLPLSLTPLPHLPPSPFVCTCRVRGATHAR